MVFGHGLGQQYETTLARAVGRRTLSATQAPVGRNVHDAALRLQQVGKGCPAQVKRNIEIDRHCLAPVIVADIRHAAADDDAGVIDEAIDLAKLVNGLRDEFVAVLRLDELARPRDNSLGYVSDFFEATFVTARGHDVPAVFRESDGNSGTDAGTRACDQYNTHVDFP